MNRRPHVQNANNVPIQAPLITHPVIPYSNKNSKSVYAIFEVEEEVVRAYLEPTPFEYKSNVVYAWVNDFLDSPQQPYMDSGLMVEAKYKDIEGGHIIFEYENYDESVAAGREIWGYPKKQGDVRLNKKANHVRASVSRRGHKLIDITCQLKDNVAEKFPRPKTTPHLNLQTIPNAEGPGYFMRRVIARDNSSECKLLEEKIGDIEIKLTSGPTDPIGDFQPKRIIGGGYSVLDFLASEQYGYGKVLETFYGE